jgi:hypothetical protein
VIGVSQECSGYWTVGLFSPTIRKRMGGFRRGMGEAYPLRPRVLAATIRSGRYVGNRIALGLDAPDHFEGRHTRRRQMLLSLKAARVLTRSVAFMVLQPLDSPKTSPQPRAVPISLSASRYTLSESHYAQFYLWFATTRLSSFCQSPCSWNRSTGWRLLSLTRAANLVTRPGSHARRTRPHPGEAQIAADPTLLSQLRDH